MCIYMHFCTSVHITMWNTLLQYGKVWGECLILLKNKNCYQSPYSCSGYVSCLKICGNTYLPKTQSWNQSAEGEHNQQHNPLLCEMFKCSLAHCWGNKLPTAFNKKKKCLLSIVQHIAHNLAPSFSHTRACTNCMQTCSNRIHLYCSITAYSSFSKTTRFCAPHRLVTEKKMETLKISWHSSLKTECAFQDKKKAKFFASFFHMTKAFDKMWCEHLLL